MQTPMPAMLKLDARLGEPGTCFSAWIAQDPLAALVFARQGYDAVTLDLQHGRIDVARAIEGIMISSGVGLPTLARIPVGEFQTGARLLDAGAAAIIAPMVNSVADARALVDCCKYPPIGARSFGAYAALAMSGFDRLDFLRRSNTVCKLFAMVETRAAMACLDEILAVDGIDGLFVGPADLSIALTDGRAIDASHPAVTESLDLVVAACRRAAKVAGVYALTGEWASQAARAGFDFVAVSSDVMSLTAGSALAIDAARRG